MGALAAFVLVNQHDLVPIFFLTHNITELVLLIQVMFLALVAADCEWKEKEITVQEGEAVRFNTVFEIFDTTSTILDSTVFDIIILPL